MQMEIGISFGVPKVNHSRSDQCPNSCALCDVSIEDNEVFFNCLQEQLTIWQTLGMWTAVQQELLPGRFVAEIMFCIMQNFSAEQIKIWNNDSESRAVVCDGVGKGPRNQKFCHCTTAFETIISFVKTSIRKIQIQC